jgi:NitT/TauT family transport system permease protein
MLFSSEGGHEMKKASTVFFPLIPLVLITGLSEVLVGAGIIPKYLLPAPSQVLAVLIEDPGTFGGAILETAKASGLGLLISVVLGLLIALLLSFSSLIRKMFYPYAIFFQTVPIIAIAPLLVIWLGYGLPTVVASSFIVSVFPVIANSVTGLLSTEPIWLDLFQLMDASRFQTLFKLRFPAALPQIFSGFRIAAGLAVIGAIVGEFIAGTGLGGLVDTARNQQRVDRVFAAVLLAAVLGILYFGALAAVSRFFLLDQKENSNG